MTSHNRHWLIAILVALGVAVVSLPTALWWYRIGGTTRAAVSTSDLGLPDRYGPTAVDPSFALAKVPGNSLSVSRHPSLQLTWRNKDNWEFDEQVVLLKNATSATIYYHNDDPRRLYRERYKGHVATANVNERLEGPDSWTVACGAYDGPASSSLDHCDVWLYWARYGQYVVYLRLVTRGVGVDAFLSYVRLADQYFELKIP